MKGGVDIMAALKCANCGANIPDKAAFCPGCGAPKVENQPEQKQPTQTPQPVQQQPSKSIPELVESIFTETNMFIMIPLGVLLACIGGLINFYGGFNYSTAGIIVNVLGVLFIGMFLLMGGITIKNYDKFVRLGMILGGAIMLTWTISIPA
jgi:hypothetical protein